MRKRTSIIWTLNKDELSSLIGRSSSLADVLRYFGLHVGAGNYRTLRARLAEERIEYSHIKLGLDRNKGRRFNRASIPLEDLLTANSTYDRKDLKRRLIAENLLTETCSECRISNVWNGKQLTIQLDHINGISNDNRIENLRMLCPNCHSQTGTYAGRNMAISSKG